MSSICSACNVSLEEDGSEVKCNGSCGRMFHADCVGSKKTRSAWKCKECKNSSQSSVKSNTAIETPITKEFMQRVFEEFKRHVCAELSTFNAQLGDYKNNTEGLSGIIDKNNSFMSDLKKEMADLKKQNKELLTTNKALSTEVGELRDRVRTLEQYTRRCNVEVSGIPFTRGEDVLKIIKDVGAALGVPTQEEDVAVAHRIPTYRKDNVQSIVVQFERRKTRDSWVNSFKQKKTLTASEVNTIFPTTKVWVNEHLSPENKFFLSKLKRKCRDIGFKYAWCRDGKFYARKTDGERYKRILNENDIKELE